MQSYQLLPFPSSTWIELCCHGLGLSFLFPLLVLPALSDLLGISAISQIFPKARSVPRVHVAWGESAAQAAEMETVLES
jgi:hypothetical protein